MSDETPAVRQPITVPDLGCGTETLKISAWLADVGQTVITGDRIVELLIPGITFDISATVTGQLAEITRPVDAIVQAGEIVGWIATE